MTKRSAGVRQLRRDDVTARILQIGRAHLAEHGAAALSLRAVTRELGMVSSAVYRYVANRDELLTLLVIDAYTEVADAVDAAVAAADARPWSARILVAATALREWAVREPARYALIYGSPVPGYAAPESTIGPGTRFVRTLNRLVAEGAAAGDLAGGSPEAGAPLAASLRRDLAAVAAELDVHLDPDVLARAVLVWSVIMGAVSLEVFGQYGPDTFGEPGLLFEHQVRVTVAALANRPHPAA